MLCVIDPANPTATIKAFPEKVTDEGPLTYALISAALGGLTWKSQEDAANIINLVDTSSRRC